MRNETFLDAFVAALETARAATGGGSECVPAALLWPDEAREWEQLVPQVATRLPVLTLGDYEGGALRGPAYWLRCVVDGALKPDGVGAGSGAPIAYLPGIGRAHLRAIEDAPASLQPIAELQYRGAIFSQSNGRDWTIRAFLGTGGLGLDVAGDNATRDAIRQARSVLGAVPIERLRSATPLRAEFFQDLLAPDLARLVLDWLDDPASFQTRLSDDRWNAFQAQVRGQHGLDLVADGPVKFAERLGRRPDDVWAALWRRFCEAPGQYPHIPDRLRAARPRETTKAPTLFDFDRLDSWPQVNEEEENVLRRGLEMLSPTDPADARRGVEALDAQHRGRREWVWAKLEMAPLAQALEPLTELARVTSAALNGHDATEIAGRYAEWGWRADDAVMRTLAAVTSARDVVAVERAIRAVYADWLDSASAAFQKAVASSGYKPHTPADWPSGTCVVFTDGLRLDVANRLQTALHARGLAVELEPALSALPTITPTAKPFVSPAAGNLGSGPGLTPIVVGGAQRLSADALRKQISAVGYQVLESSETGDPAGRAWTELGDIDSLGHEQTSKLPRLIEGEVASLAERISTLLAVGWQQVVVVTDHGWLYLPGGLPKVELPQHLTQDGAMRKARCGRLAQHASTGLQTVPWTWDPAVSVAIAPGSSAFEVGQVFEHGGVSPQECVTAVIIATGVAGAAAGPVTISIHWRGLRAVVNVEGAPRGAQVDLRRKAGDRASTFLSSPAAVSQGEARLLVEDTDAEGTAAFLVVIDEMSNVLAQSTVTVGVDA